MTNSDEYSALDELRIMSFAVNYNYWIWKSIKPYVGKIVLEIGAGIGTFTNYLQESDKVYATDIAPNCIGILKNRFYAQSKITIERFDMTQPQNQELWNRRGIDTLICLNVLEHIEDDLAALFNVGSILIPGAKIILMVPAFQFAFGTIDKLDGHYRRYSKKNLIHKLRNSRFEPIKVQYFNSIGLFAWFYSNKIAKYTSTSAFNVKIYDRFIVPSLSVVESAIIPPFGQSLIAVGRRT